MNNRLRTLRFLITVILFILAINPLFAYRAFSPNYTGTVGTALGGASAAILTHPESVLYNPAGLTTYQGSGIFYETDTEIIVETLVRWDYDVTFDEFFAFGGFVLSLGESPFTLGTTVATIFTGTPRDDDNFRTRQAGVTLAYEANDRLSLGATAGLIIATDSLDDSFYLALSFQGTFGLLMRRTDWHTYGVSVSTPIYLDWGRYLGGSVTTEWLPFTVRFGNRFELSPSIRIFADLEYTGWSFASFTQDGITEFIGVEPVSLGRTLHPHFGFEFYDRGQLGGRQYAGGTYRVGIQTKSFIESDNVTGDAIITSRWYVTFGAMLFAGEHIRASVTVVDMLIFKGIFSALENLGGFDGSYVATEQIRLSLDMNLSFFEQDEPAEEETEPDTVEPMIDPIPESSEEDVADDDIIETPTETVAEEAPPGNGISTEQAIPIDTFDTTQTNEGANGEN